MLRRTLCYFLFGCMASIASVAQVPAPPVPQRLVVHSNVLNEDRVIWVRMPAAAQGKKESYAVLKIDEALATFRRNVELYPRSANGYDSLADGLEAAGKHDLAVQNVEKAVEVATQTGDPLLPAFKKHLERLVASGKLAPGKGK